MVAELKGAAVWRREDCGDTCVLRMVILPGLSGREPIEIHDPSVHYEAGRAAGGDVAARLVLESGPLVLWRRELQLWVDGREVFLSRTEWGILLALVDADDALVRHSALLTQVWGAAYATDAHLLRVNLARVRKKLGAAEGLIETVHGIGYRFRFVPPGEAAEPPTFTFGRPRLQGQWARHFSACQRCRTTDLPHKGRGYCRPCYDRILKRGVFDRALSRRAIAHQEAAS